MSWSRKVKSFPLFWIVLYWVSNIYLAWNGKVPWERIYHSAIFLSVTFLRCGVLKSMETCCRVILQSCGFFSWKNACVSYLKIILHQKMQFLMIKRWISQELLFWRHDLGQLVHLVHSRLVSVRPLFLFRFCVMYYCKMFQSGAHHSERATPWQEYGIVVRCCSN